MAALTTPFLAPTACHAQSPFTHRKSATVGSSRRCFTVCRAALQPSLRSTETLRPVRGEVAASAPATVANLGPGFDWLGCAVEGPGDTVVAVALPTARPGEIVIQRVTGEGGRLSLDPVKNCAGIAAAATLRAMGAQLACGVGLTLHKGLPLGSGLGSSAASAAAAAVAVNELFGAPLSPMDLVLPGLESEAAVSGYHADNIAPALLGGFVLIRSCEPLDLQRLAFPGGDVWFALVNPCFEAPTAEMRAALRSEVPMAELTRNCAAGASLVAGILLGDAGLLGRSLDADVVVEPVRGPLIPGFAAVKAAARGAGAYGCTISGAGPTAVAVVPDPDTGARVAEAMSAAFKRAGNLDTNSAQVVRLNQQGARKV
ncbi:hypothetical protein ACKKBF_B15920 [Auxenochlorella protothecoides x Auxenochlorella symbiontica]